MGQIFSQDSANDNDRKTYNSLQEIFESTKAKMYIAALNDECLPIVCAVDKFHEFLFQVDQIEDNDLKKKINDILQKHLSSEHLDEMVELMKRGLNSLLLSASATSALKELESVRQMHVVHANRSLLRIDYFVHWVKQVNDKKALFYYVQVGVIDMARVRLPVLIYELTRATKEDHIEEVGNKLKRKANSTILLNEAAQTLVKAARGEKGILRDGGSGTTHNETRNTSTEDGVSRDG